MKELRKHLFILPVFAVLFVAYYFFASSGTWDIFAPTKFYGSEKIYEAQAKSLLYGKLAIDPRAAGCEGIIVDNSVYCYFGLTPALARVVLNTLVPALEGRWHRVMILFYTFAAMVLFYCILQFFIAYYKIGRDAYAKMMTALCVVVFGLGSTNVFMDTKPVLYHEALAGSVCFSLLSYLLTLLYVSSRKRGYLAWSCISCLFAINTRPLAAFGAVGFLLIVLALDLLSAAKQGSFLSSLGARAAGFFALDFKKEAFFRTAARTALVLLVFSTVFLVNYAKFGSFFNVPLKQHSAYIFDRDRINRTGGKLFSWSNLKINLDSYFAFTGLSLQDELPWITIKGYKTNELMEEYPGCRIDLKESTVGLPLSSPLIAILALAGLAACFAPGSRYKLLRAPVIASFVGSASVLFYMFISHRFLHDFFPFLVFSCMPAVLYLLSVAEKHRRYVFYPFLALATVDIAVNLIICMDSVVGYFKNSGFSLPFSIALRALGRHP